MNIAVLAHPPVETARLAETLSASGLSVQSCADLSALLAYLGQSACDLVVVAADSLGPAADEALERLRAAGQADTPLLLLAEVPAHEECILALRAHDDYLVKPVRRHELLGRARVLLRRTRPDHPAWNGIVIDRFTFDPRKTTVRYGDTTVALTRKEYELAQLLLRHIGRPLSRAYLLETLWPQEADRPSRTLDTHVSRVRNKLDLRPGNGYRLTPVYSFGYLLERVLAREEAGIP